VAKTKIDKKLYQRIREGGVRKTVARELAQLPALGSNGSRIPKAMRDAVDRLDSVATELKKHAAGGGRGRTARKRATRKSSARKATARKPAARKPAARKPARGRRASTRKASSARKPAVRRQGARSPRPPA
jgi:hypothetical protein